MQWLVKQAYAYKDEIADATRRLSASHFHRHHFSLPSDTELAARRSTALPAAEQLNSSYVPTRRFKPKAEIASQQQPPGIHARRVLMEYGAQLAALVAQQATAEEEGEKEKQRKSKTKAESSAPSATPTGASDLSAADMSLWRTVRAIALIKPASASWCVWARRKSWRPRPNSSESRSC